MPSPSAGSLLSMHYLCTGSLAQAPSSACIPSAQASSLHVRPLCKLTLPRQAPRAQEAPGQGPQDCPDELPHMRMRAGAGSPRTDPCIATLALSSCPGPTRASHARRICPEARACHARREGSGHRRLLHRCGRASRPGYRQRRHRHGASIRPAVCSPLMAHAGSCWAPAAMQRWPSAAGWPARWVAARAPARCGT